MGVFNTLRPKGPLDSTSEIMGAAFETLILQNIMAQNSYKKWSYDISFWRTKNQREVDFILYGSRGFFAIEVKSSSRLRDDDFKGLIEFQKDYKEAQCLMVYAGAKSYKQGKINVLSIHDFLKKELNRF